MSKFWKEYKEVVQLIGLYLLILLVGFLASSLVFVASWDWSAVPMFHAPAAPYTAGMGLSLLIAVVVTIIEVFRNRK